MELNLVEWKHCGRKDFLGDCQLLNMLCFNVQCISKWMGSLIGHWIMKFGNQGKYLA